MIRNYLKTAYRSLFKNKVHSFINIAGLSVGMAVAILIGLWIKDELSYDSYNKNYDQVAEVMQQYRINDQVITDYPSPIALANELRNNYGSEFKHVVLSWWNRNHLLSYGEKKFIQNGKFMEPGAPDILSLNMLKGTKDGLKDPSSILISSAAAKIIFGDEDPMNKLMKIDNKMDVKVTGIYEDIPYNSKFNKTSFIAAWDLNVAANPWMQKAKDNWAENSFEIYVQLAPNTGIDKVSSKIRNSKFNNLKNDPEEAAYKPVVFLRPMSRWHLYSEWKNGINTGGAIQFVWLFGIIGLFVLLLACINFMNLSTARSEKRAKEIGIRKAVGSLRIHLIVQFFCESLLVTLFAFLLSLVLVQLVIPLFNQVADKKLFIPWSSPLFWLMGFAFSFITGIIAGSYPAFYLSSFQPIKVLKGVFKAGRFSAVPRKVLVVVQFSVSVILIIGTIVVFQQIHFAMNRQMGYSRDQLIELQMNTPEFRGHEQLLRDDLLKSGAVTEVTESSSPTTAVWSNRSGFSWQGKSPGFQAEFGVIAVTHEYGKTLGWQFNKGRDFSRDFSTDSSGLVINEAAEKYMGLKNAVGETINWGGNLFKVIGVIKNMIMESPYEPVRPTVYSLKNETLNFIFIKLSPSAGISESLNKIEKVFQKDIPSAAFDYKFADELFAQKFSAEQRIGKLASWFAILAIFISCLGLFGMASFMAEQRVKEIGIRKVLGASVVNIWQLLSWDFIILIIISLLIAIPVAYYFMHQWLQNYQYHTVISWWIFAAAGAGALFITLLTVSYQSVRAALENPVNSLKSE